MRILVVSDSHGDSYAVRQAVTEQPTAEMMFFLGDGEYDLKFLDNTLSRFYVHKVKGNCDIYSSLPANVIDEVNGKRIYATHGYAERVKYGTELLKQCAADNDVSLVLFGHTHVPVTVYEDGVWYVNPGSVRDGKYAVVDITDNGGIMPILMNLRY